MVADISLPTATPRAVAASRRLLSRNAAWSLVGNLVYAGSQWAALAVLARLGSAAVVGRYALGLAVVTPIFQLANLQLRNVLVTDATGRHPFGEYLALRLATTVAALLAVLAVAGLGGFGAQNAAAIVAVGVAKAIEAVIDLVHGLFQQHERMDRAAASLIVGGVLSVPAIGVTFALTGSLTAAVAALAAVWAVRLLARDLPTAARTLNPSGWAAIRPRWDPGAAARLAWLALPLGVTMMLLALNASLPRFFLERSLGEAALGVFAALSYPLVAGNLVLGACGQATAPRLARLFAAGDLAGFAALVGRFVALAFGVGAIAVVVCVVAGRPLLVLMYGPVYGESAAAFAWIASASAVAFVATPLGVALTAARILRAQAPLFVAVAATTAAGSAWLIPRYGLAGAAWALAASYAVQVAGSLALLAIAFARRGAAR